MKKTYDLQFDSLAVELDGLDLEINADHRKYAGGENKSSRNEKGCEKSLASEVTHGNKGT